MSAEDWTTQGAYQPLHRLSMAELAFELLRRNQAYREDYRQAHAPAGAAATRPDREGVTDPAARWRLLFPLAAASFGGGSTGLLAS